uniref:Si:dkey-4p15.5 n=1 Tax=Nothobranchius furzeri TaxID=105023 RepID=A0A8C6KLH3_NOTFU
MKRLWLAILVCLLSTQADAQIPLKCVTDPTNRAPGSCCFLPKHLFSNTCYISYYSFFSLLIDNTDITVNCGTQSMDLSIYLCPIYNSQYNESLMVLNNQISNPLCYGTADWTVSPPVLRFRFPINDTSLSSCANIYQVFYLTAGTGQWSDFSNVQTVNISGMVTAIDPSVGVISYRQQILYKFSCAYPLQYLLNNSQLSVSGANVAIRDNNASFISTLSMQLYKDRLYQEVLTIPPTGLKFLSKIYVEVKATNLTAKFNLLLDRCYATTSPLPMQSTYYDLFVGCQRDPNTVVETNGVSQTARFNFQAFRFVEQRNLTVSSFYLHCTTRLCDNCNAPVGRRKRAVAEDVPTSATITSQAISVNKDNTGAFQRKINANQFV